MNTFVVIDYGWAEVAVAAAAAVVVAVAAEVAAVGRTVARIAVELRVTDDVVVGAVVADEGVAVAAVVGDEGVAVSEPECWRPWRVKGRCWQA